MSRNEQGYLVVIVLLFMSVLVLLWPSKNPYAPPAHLYKIMRKGEEAFPLRADRIDRRDGCVIFYRGDRIDTILCEGMGDVVVTEAFE